jgi:hypothetical protein
MARQNAYSAASRIAWQIGLDSNDSSIRLPALVMESTELLVPATSVLRWSWAICFCITLKLRLAQVSVGPSILRKLSDRLGLQFRH